MVVIITGASHTGKTALAQRLLEKYKFPYLSIDHLKMGLIRSGNTDLTPMDDNELTAYLWPIVREVIKTAIENRQNLIVEGCYVPFDWSKDFEKEYLDNIGYYCLVMSEKYIKNHFYGWYHLYGHVHISFEENMVQNFKRQMKELYDKPLNMWNVGCMIGYMNYTPRTLEEIIRSTETN